jgi:outer membrane lipoprotein
MSRLWLLIPLLFLAACATMPESLSRGGPYADITPTQALRGDHQGLPVRWGGVLVQTRPRDPLTCFEVVGLHLDARGEPLESDASSGRFTACAAGFFDPAIYAEGRLLTFTGRIAGIGSQRIGEQEYRVPRLEAGTIYLWPKRREVIYVPYPAPYWDPYWPRYWP